MFGGYGLYSDGVIFALITSDDVLHFKVDDSNRALYEDAGMQQFHNMPYFRVASDWYDNPEKLYELARQSVEVSKRGKSNLGPAIGCRLLIDRSSVSRIGNPTGG